MKNRSYNDYGKKALFTSLTAAALYLVAGSPRTVQAASIAGNRSAALKNTKTRNKSAVANNKTVRKTSKEKKTGIAIAAEANNENKQSQQLDQSSSDSVTVTAHYVNQKGEQVVPDEQLTGKINDSYPDKELPGYKIVTKPVGEFSSQENEVTYVYTDSANQTDELMGQESQAKIEPRSESSYNWSGLTVTFDDSTGLLTIPGGTVNNPQSLVERFGLDFVKTEIKKININGLLKVTGSANSMFAHCRNLEEIKGLTNLNTSDVTSMRLMFQYCYKLNSIDVSNFDTGKVEDMFGMFWNCQKLTSLDASSFKTNQVKNMMSMFFDCSNLTNLDISGFNMVNVKSKDYMLHNLRNLNTLILGKDNIISGTGFNTSGYWLNVSDGTQDKPQGRRRWKAADLMAEYKGADDHDTYVRFAGVTVVHHCDEDNKTLARDDILTGEVKDEYKSQPKEIPGYVLKSRPTEESGTFTDDVKEITYYYTNQVTVDVHYVDQDDKEIVLPNLPKTLTGKIGNPYPDQPIAGYVQERKPTGTFSPTETEVYYYYTNKVTVTAHYLDKSGNKVAKDETLTGTIGDPYPDQPIAGYVQERKPTGTFSPTETEVTYYYTNEVTVTAHYLDQSGNKVAKDETLMGTIGDPYPDKELPGYVLLDKPKGQYSDKVKEVTYVYAKVAAPSPEQADQGAAVTVHYQDAKGNPLASDEVLTGKVGAGYVSAAKTIKGYVLVTKPGNATGFFSQNPQSVTYIYAPVESENGKQPEQNGSGSGNTGQNQTTTHHSNSKGKRPHGSQNNNQTQTEKRGQGHKATATEKETRKETESGKQLPQTGSAEGEKTAAWLLGSLSVISGLIGGWINRRKKN